jgi:GT2 family glycosyltransferase
MRGRQPDLATDVDWMLGACLLVRRSILTTVGGFDPDYFLYGEEIDLQYRIRQLGWRVVYVPSRGVVHHAGQSTRQAPLTTTLHNYRGRWLFVRKHYPWWSSGAYMVKTVTALLIWLVYWATRGSGAEARQQCRAYLRLLAWHLGGRGPLPEPRAGT